MNDKQYYTGAAIVFTVIGIAHFMRIIWEIEASIAGYYIPYWVSGIVVLICGYLAFRGFQAAKKKRHFCLW